VIQEVKAADIWLQGNAVMSARYVDMHHSWLKLHNTGDWLPASHTCPTHIHCLRRPLSVQEPQITHLPCWFEVVFSLITPVPLTTELWKLKTPRVIHAWPRRDDVNI